LKPSQSKTPLEEVWVIVVLSAVLVMVADPADTVPPVGSASACVAPSMVPAAIPRAP
jgi:hypothetical protein